jgi:hypothetical protein
MTGRKKFGIGSFVVLLAIVALVLMGRPPTIWRQIEAGMGRPIVYSLLGKPCLSNESTKGGVRWRKDLFIGRWEFDVFFHDDETVGAFGKSWRWNGW